MAVLREDLRQKDRGLTKLWKVIRGVSPAPKEQSSYRLKRGESLRLIYRALYGSVFCSVFLFSMINSIITNNPAVREKYSDIYDVEFVDSGPEGVFIRVRDRIHAGRILLTHPISGGTNPGENPYRSVLISGETGPLDYDSLKIIEECIASLKKFQKNKSIIPENFLEDYKELDLKLIGAAVDRR